MNQKQYDGLSDEQRRLVAVAYALEHADMQPKGSEILFQKLASYDGQAKATDNGIKEAQKFITESQSKLHELIGAINAVSGIIAETLEPDQIQEWCMAYNMPGDKPATTIPETKKPASVDMAGATAKNLPPVDVGSLAKGE